MTKIALFATPGVTHPSEVWKFWTKKPIQATNFEVRVVWDGLKYHWYFTLSETPVYPNEWLELKMGLKIVHPRSAQKGSKTRQNDEVQRVEIPDFLTFSAKIWKFKPREPNIWPGWQNSGI